MAFILDTSALVAMIGNTPDTALLDWIGPRPAKEFYISALSLADLHGYAGWIKSQTQQRRFEDWLQVALPAQFDGRILSFDQSAAAQWGALSSASGNNGPGEAGRLLAAIALAYGFTIVTRKPETFSGIEVSIVNPWVNKH